MLVSVVQVGLKLSFQFEKLLLLLVAQRVDAAGEVGRRCLDSQDGFGEAGVELFVNRKLVCAAAAETVLVDHFGPGRVVLV